MKKIKTFIMISIVIHTCLWGSPVSNLPVTITQPSGIQIACFATGDEYYNWLHDKDGYTIVQNPNTGYYCYAILAGEDLIASPYIVGEPLPKFANIKPYTNISGEKILEKIDEFLQNRPSDDCFANADFSLPGILKTLNNIVIYIRFADQAEFPLEQNFYTSIFNDVNPGVNSMRGYFQEATYSNWDVVSHFYPVNNNIYDDDFSISNSNRIFSYKDPHPRGYYCPWSIDNPIGYHWEGGFRRDTLLFNAVDYIKNQIPLSLNIDCNNDDQVDNICFIIRGDYEGTAFWPHRSAFSRYIHINEKRVCNYNLHIEGFLKQTDIGEAAVLCHEMCHTFGLPDVYHRNQQHHPLGLWDVMGMPWNPVQHMCGYMKYKYGKWISTISSITTSGTYTLQLLTESLNATPYPNCYKIPIKGSSQYLIVEYRKHRPGMFDGCIPSGQFGNSGLIIYRINEELDYTLGEHGPGGIKDRIYVFRSDGTISSEGDYRHAYFSEATGRTVFSNNSNPYCFYVSNPPPTSYYGNIYIKNIRENQEKTLISFDIRFCDDDNIIYSNTGYLPTLTNASNSIQTANTVIVKKTDNVTFEAGNEVILEAGFEVELGGAFEININKCGEK